MEDSNNKVNTIYKEENFAGNPLKIIKLGSDVGATKNMTVYETANDIIIVDCGIGFPDSELFGVDVVIPDVTYLLDNKHKLRGLFVTHAHEDHLGAIPYVIDELNVPIYANKLVQGFIKERLKDKYQTAQVENVSFNLITPETDEITVGDFKVKAFGINHSVPSGMGFAIKTPQGTVLHIADYKIDFTPVLDKPIELGKIANYGDAGVLCLLSDCLRVTTEGFTKSERTLNETFGHFFEKAEGRQIFVTTISSNISRMYQIINAAKKYGRKVVFSGRSMEQSSRVARELGYLPFDDTEFVDEKEAENYKQDSLVYVIAGCYGQSGSGLERLSRGEHQNIQLMDDALVIFSADPNPPGVQEPVERLLHNLTVRGSEVIYSEIQDNLHVSGHGLKGDIMTVTALSKAKYYIPIGGTAAKQRAYTNMAKDLGIERERVFELLEGDVLEFRDGKAKLDERIEVKPVYIDGRFKKELSPVVVKDREQLSEEGVFVAVIPIDASGKLYPNKVEIVTRGFIYVKSSQALMDKSRKFITEKLNKLEKEKDWNSVRRKVERDLDKFLFKETGRSPLIIVHTIVI